LGRRFTEFETPQRAALAYGQVYDVAILSSRLNDPARADALLAAGKGWAAVGERDSALQAFDQVYVIATESPYIQLAHRRDLLTSLEAAYRDLDEPELADRTREQIVRLDREDYRPPGQPVEWPELPLESEPVSSAEVGELEEARRQAAFEVVDLLGGGVQPAPEEIDRLTQALLAEDAAKTGLYAEQLAQTTQSGRRINIHWHRIGWLMLKYQVAMRGLGMSVVPEWESQVREIQAALSTAYEDLRFDYEDFVTALPAASLMEPGNYQVRRQVILAGRLGQYPNYPETQLAGRLRDSVGQLIGAGLVEQLYVDWTQEEWGLNFFLSPADAYRDAN
jgi:tetratricopeptide (TPR) repeat protein